MSCRPCRYSPSCHKAMPSWLAEARGVGVIVAQELAPPVQHLIPEFPGVRVLTQLTQVRDELGGRDEGVGSSSLSNRRRRVSVSSSSARARWYSPSIARFHARLLAEVSSPRSRRGVRAEPFGNGRPAHPQGI
jgi:hypothetical protein